ncbi:MAG: hypothetical protein Q4G58_17030 [bacterium]|nr:hypothetical protein [bacterium]
MMGTRKKIYRHFVLESVGFYLIAFLAGTASSSVVNIFTRADYVLSLYSVFAILNLIVAIYVKGFIDKEFTSFRCSRKDIIRINFLSDLSIGLLEAVLLGGIIRLSYSFKYVNKGMKLLELNERMARIPAVQYMAFFFLLVMAVQAIVTFDFMCNKGVFQTFYSGAKSGSGKGYKQGIMGVGAYMVMTIVLGFTVAAFTQVEQQNIRIALLLVLFIIAVIFYVFAFIKVRRKEFYVENA